VNTVSNWGNPHNDYLRIFHDLGAIGLLLFVFAWAERLIRHWKGWRKLRLAAPHLGKYHLAAFCAGTAIGVSFLTDNTLVYAFVMVPFFILSGMAIAASDLYFRPANAIVHQPLPDQLPVPTTVGP
jgi:O-antigen ligase